MKTIHVASTFNNDDLCLEYLCDLRWHKQPECPYCRSKKTSKKEEKNRRSRLQCHDCHKSFSPTVNTIMHGTRIPLSKWFLAVSLIVEAKKSISSRQLARHLDLPVKTAYSLSQRIRKGMLGTKSPFLKGIIEIDETYIGGKPRYPSKGSIHKRGCGTDKQMVVGMVKRGGDMVTAIPKDNRYCSKDVRDMILDKVDIGKATRYTDEYRIYLHIGKWAKHDYIKHSVKEYSRGDVHANTVEGFWALVKRAWYGTHHHYSVKYLPYYIAEAQFKYNHRDKEDQLFNKALENIATEQCTHLSTFSRV